MSLAGYGIVPRRVSCDRGLWIREDDRSESAFATPGDVLRIFEPFRSNFMIIRLGERELALGIWIPDLGALFLVTGDCFSHLEL